MKLIGMAEEKKKLTAAIKNRIPALLIGETGTGKTSVAKEAAGEMGLETVRVNLDGGVTPDEIIGRYQAKAEDGVTVTYFQEGVIPRAMRSGSVLILDELNAALPDTLFCLHALLEENPRLFVPETQEEIIPKEGFTVIATMNPSHEYAGTKGLNAALYSRFGMVIRFRKLEGANFLEALASHVPGLGANKAEKICAVIEECEKLRSAEKINTRLTLREAIAAGKFSMDGLTLKEAIQSALVDKLEGYERALLSPRWAVDAIPSSDTVEDIFRRALQTSQAEEKVAQLQTRLDELKELEGVLSLIARKKEAVPAKAVKRGKLTVESGTDDAIAFNPEDVDPWARKGAK